MLSLSDINVKVGIGKGVFEAPGATVIGGQQNIDQLIKSLFANNEQGFAYDPNDLTTMFQDAAGTVPVTGAGQPVGLMLDKSKGLVVGPELINNGTFESLSFWTTNNTAKIELVSSKLRFTRLAGADSVSQPFQTEVGKFYKVKVNALVVSGSFARAACGAINSISSSQNKLINSFIGALSFIFQATSTTSYVLLGAASDNSVIDYDDVSIMEIAGNHAYQTTSSMRPLLVASPQRLDYDIADDNLITNLPSQLTGCTVIRAVPNVGTQILTNQTIPATYNDNTDHCGLIVINRALTATETSQITKLFNKAAGV